MHAVGSMQEQHLADQCIYKSIFSSNGAMHTTIAVAYDVDGILALLAMHAEFAKSPFRQDLLKEASPEPDKQQQQETDGSSGGVSGSGASFSNNAGSGSGSFTSADASSLRELLK
jgi:hypothetical protein